MTAPNLTALALVCSLKRRPAESSSELIADQVCENLKVLGVGTETLRCADYVIEPGVETDMGGDDQWPPIREKVLAADILLLSTPVWLGHPSSIAQRVLERLDAELSNTDDAAGRCWRARWRWCLSSATRTARTRRSPISSRR